MELLENGDAQVISGYNHYAWKVYAAVTRKEFGKRPLYLYGLYDLACLSESSAYRNMAGKKAGGPGNRKFIFP